MWHSWISYVIDTPPPQDPLYGKPRSWAKPVHIPNLTFSRSAYKPYNTYDPLSALLLPARADAFTESSPRSKPGSPSPWRGKGENQKETSPPATQCTYACVGNRVPLRQLHRFVLDLLLRGSLCSLACQNGRQLRKCIQHVDDIGTKLNLDAKCDQFTCLSADPD